MALIGGAGNPVGGSFTGPQEALEIIQDHAYAFSGKFAASTTAQTMFDFTTGNYMFVGKIDFYGLVDPDLSTNGGISTFALSLNGSQLVLAKTDTTSNQDMPSQGHFNIIIPPYTEVTLVVDNVENTANEYNTATMSGRIYRG
jgi:hypothetical protein